MIYSNKIPHTTAFFGNKVSLFFFLHYKGKNTCSTSVTGNEQGLVQNNKPQGKAAGLNWSWVYLNSVAR